MSSRDVCSTALVLLLAACGSSSHSTASSQPTTSIATTSSIGATSSSATTETTSSTATSATAINTNDVCTNDRSRIGTAMANADGVDPSSVVVLVCVMKQPGLGYAAITYIDPATHARVRGLLQGFIQGWRPLGPVGPACSVYTDIPAAVHQAACG